MTWLMVGKGEQRSGDDGDMTCNAAAMTAKLAAAGRAVESKGRDHLFDDPLAAALVGVEGFDWLEEWRVPGAPMENPTIG